MVDWRTYRIASKTVSSSYILFSLDNYVSYNNGNNNYKHIYCSNYSPFYSWRENDFIEINNDVTRHRDSGHYFSRNDELRISCSHGCGHSYEEYEDLKTKCNALERERNDLRNDLNEWKGKYDEIKEQLNTERIDGLNSRAAERLEEQRTRSALESRSTLLEKDLTNARDENTSLKNLIEEGKTESGLIRTEKGQKDEEVRRIEEQLANLRIEKERELTQKNNQLSEKENELRFKDEEIQRLRSWKGQSKEELLTEKLNSERQNLELFSTELGASLEQIQGLIRYHERLFQARKNHNQSNIETHEDNIAQVKEELRVVNISMINIQEISRKCDKIAELSWELTQIQTQQYEAKQEVPTN